MSQGCFQVWVYKIDTSTQLPIPIRVLQISLMCLSYKFTISEGRLSSSHSQRSLYLFIHYSQIFAECAPYVWTVLVVSRQHDLGLPSPSLVSFLIPWCPRDAHCTNVFPDWLTINTLWNTIRQKLYSVINFQRANSLLLTWMSPWGTEKCCITCVCLTLRDNAILINNRSVKRAVVATSGNSFEQFLCRLNNNTVPKEMSSHLLSARVGIYSPYKM